MRIGQRTCASALDPRLAGVMLTRQQRALVAALLVTPGAVPSDELLRAMGSKSDGTAMVRVQLHKIRRSLAAVPGCALEIRPLGLGRYQAVWPRSPREGWAGKYARERRVVAL